MSDRAAEGLALRFRHLAGELRRVSGYGDAHREFERLLCRVSWVFRDAFNTRRLPGPFLSLLDADNPHGFLSWVKRVDGSFEPPMYNAWEIDNQISFNLLGYWKPYVFFESTDLADKENCGDRSFVAFLKAGPVSTVWPSVFEDICIATSGHTHDIGNWRSANWPWIAMCETDARDNRDVQRIFREGVDNNRFTIMGYYATACDLLAEWIENHADDDRGDRAGDQSVDPFPNDGLDKEGKAFTWGGRRFDQITSGMMRVLELLDDERKKGHPNVPSAMIGHRAGVATESGMKSQVFKLNRKDWPPVHPVSEIVIDNGDGTHRLIAPDKVPAKVPGGS